MKMVSEDTYITVGILGTIFAIVSLSLQCAICKAMPTEWFVGFFSGVASFVCFWFWRKLDEKL